MTSGQRGATAAVLAALVLGAAGGYLARSGGSGIPAQATGGVPAPSARSSATDTSAGHATFTPPPDAATPKGPFGDMVRHGRALFTHTRDSLPQYVGNDLNCENCHLDAGRMANSAPMWAAWVDYPKYRSKNKMVNTMVDRVSGCFKYSENGKAPPPDGNEMRALQSYFYWLASGAATGRTPAGAGYPTLRNPPLKPDSSRGAVLYASQCALCHGDNGEGRRSAEGRIVFPPLWGPRSFNSGAGMHKVATAAGFIKANMPLSRGNTLTDQQAWDAATFVDSHSRPADPRAQHIAP